MTRWFRFYEESINDPKLLKLPDDMYRAWTILLCFASKNEGILPPADDIAISLRMKPSKVAEWITKLVRGGLIDNVDGRYEPHNWNGRQYKSDVSTDRVKRFRNAKRNVSETVSETPPEQIQITEQKITEPIGSGADAPLDDPSRAEREYFARGREVLGKSAGGQLVKLLKANGGNVSLSRSTLELAATKHKPAEFFARAVAPNSQGPPPDKGGFTSVLMDKHMERQNGTSDSEPEFSER